jgi:hypothetical protein|tara:strand:+ start:121 stop:411 length:291 start_codon:yes stop_codon:yes gene_type:complete
MKKLHKVGVLSLANVLALLGALTGAIKVAVFPVLALIAGGGLGDLDAAINTIGDSVTANIKDVVSFAVAGWLGGAIYAYLLNIVLGWRKGLDIEIK